jgi:hypothetical protein
MERADRAARLGGCRRWSARRRQDGAADHGDTDDPSRRREHGPIALSRRDGLRDSEIGEARHAQDERPAERVLHQEHQISVVHG